MANRGSSNAVLKVTKGQDYADSLFKQFQVMKDQNYLTDFILKVEDKEIACHKVILAARSEYFHRLFDHKDMLEVTQGFVNLQNTSFLVSQARG